VTIVSVLPSHNVLSEPRGGVLYVTLNRPHRLNAIDEAAKFELAEIMRALDEDDALRVAVLMGSDCGSFSTGSDIYEKADRRPGPSPNAAPLYCETVANCRKPVIAAIDGYCIGGGLELALACDMRFGTESSTFGLPEARIGRLGNYGIDHLSRAIPLGEAMLIHLTGGKISAQRAYQVGLLQGIFEDRASLLDRVGQVTADIIRCAPAAVIALKLLVRRGRNVPVEYANMLSEPYRELVHGSADAAEGLRAFREKRSPNWGFRP
jgi:enoyl-CoA hydratase/carnithine racemase